MITKDNLCDLLLDMGYGEVDTGVYEKKYPDFDCSITVDYNKELIIYPEEKGFQVNDRTTSNFDENENFVVLECVDRLLTKGYRPEKVVKQISMLLIQRGKNVYLLLSVKLMGMNIGKN